MRIIPWTFYQKVDRTNAGLPVWISQAITYCKDMVFCYQNCSDLLWEKNCSSDLEKLLKFKAEGQEFAKILRWLEQFI